MLNMKIYWFIAPPEEGCPIYSAVEKNLFTAEQVSRFLKISKRAARRKIKKLLAEGRITWHYIKSDYWSLANQLERASNGGKS